MDADVVIEAIGNKAPDESSEWYPNVKVDGKKLIKVDPETGQTSVPGIFAGGDIVQGSGSCGSGGSGRQSGCPGH